MREVIIGGLETVTAYGSGVRALLDGLYSGKSAITADHDFPYTQMPVAPVDGLNNDSPRCFQMLSRLAGFGVKVPESSPVFLAVTIGAIESLEEFAASESADDKYSSHINKLISHVKKLWGDRKVYTVSAACAASACAMIRASSMIASGRIDSAVIITCDSLSEFIVSGFSSIGALDERGARPFDEDRKGLSLGESAGIMVLAERSFAESEGIEANAVINGWSLNSDACHVTSPDLTGKALARAVDVAMEMAGKDQSCIAYIASHGTGTFYNDKMECEAFKLVFPDPKPTFSIKGGTGHTVAAAGLLQIAVGIEAGKQRRIPPNLNLNCVMPEMKGWISSTCVSVDHGCFLSVNSGFGGINCALVIDSL